MSSISQVQRDPPPVHHWLRGGPSAACTRRPQPLGPPRPQDRAPSAVRTPSPWSRLPVGPRIPVPRGTQQSMPGWSVLNVMLCWRGDQSSFRLCSHAAPGLVEPPRSGMISRAIWSRPGPSTHVTSRRDEIPRRGTCVFRAFGCVPVPLGIGEASEVVAPQGPDRTAFRARDGGQL